MKLKDLSRGDLFTLSSLAEPGPSQLYLKGVYNRRIRKYEMFSFSDPFNPVYIDGSREVFVDFIF